MAFLIPIMSELLQDEDFNLTIDRKREPRALIIVPTRELAVQIYDQARKLAYGLFKIDR